MVEPSEFLALFSTENNHHYTVFTPKADSLKVISDIWHSGQFNFSYFLYYSLKLAGNQQLHRHLRFSDGARGYWDIYLIREGLFLNIYNKLNWGLDEVRFFNNHLCLLQLGINGHAVESINDNHTEHGGECLFIDSDTSFNFQLRSNAPHELTKIYISFDPVYFQEQVNDAFNHGEPLNNVCLHQFLPSLKMVRLATDLICLPAEPTSILSAEGLCIGILAEAIKERMALINSQQHSKHFLLKPKDVVALEKAKQVLENNFSHSITLESVAREIGINRKKLSDGFKLLFGITFGDCLTAKRMEAAAQLLTNGALTSDIAYQVGYSTRSAFSSAFKRYFGHSPKQYIQRLRQQTQQSS